MRQLCGIVSTANHACHDNMSLVPCGCFVWHVACFVGTSCCLVPEQSEAEAGEQRVMPSVNLADYAISEPGATAESGQPMGHA